MSTHGARTRTSTHVWLWAADAVATRCHVARCLCCQDAGYRGCQTKTRTGRTCQKWTVQTPHKHTNPPDKQPGTGVGDHNYCRNPDGGDTIWCYTVRPARPLPFH